MDTARRRQGEKFDKIKKPKLNKYVNIKEIEMVVKAPSFRKATDQECLTDELHKDAQLIA